MTGAQIIQLREALGMSRPELARALNVASATMASWETEGPHHLGHEVLWGLYSAVFNQRGDAAANSARIERIAGELKLGFGAMLSMRLLDYVARGGSR